MIYRFGIMLFALSVISCGKTEVPTEPIKNTILSLGASRVEGGRPDHESFRYETWKLLLGGEWDFDLIGSESDDSEYPMFNNQAFDREHQGWSGYTSGDILEELEASLEGISPPDVALFSSPGLNDALEDLPYSAIIENINSIIDILQSKNKNITILLEQMAPAHSSVMDSALTWYIDQYHVDILTVAANKSTSMSQIIAIDMHTGFNDNMLADNVHYNQSGAEFIAERYYIALKEILEE